MQTNFSTVRLSSENMSLSKLHSKINTICEKKKSKRKNKEEAERFRPVGDDDIDEILELNCNKNTARSEKKVDKILISYLKQKKKDINYIDYSTEELDEMLSVFWFAASPKKEGSDHYSVSSLHHIRYALKRILMNHGREFDITVDPRFSKSQRLFKEACKELKRKGYGHVKHIDAIIPSGRSTFTFDTILLRLCTHISQ